MQDLCIAQIAQIQLRRHVLDHADHTDHTDHTDHDIHLSALKDLDHEL